jgi:hypothetical protein
MFGREHVVHVAIAPGRLADQLCVEATRLAGLAIRRSASAGGLSEEAGGSG